MGLASKGRQITRSLALNAALTEVQYKAKSSMEGEGRTPARVKISLATKMGL